MSQRSKQQHDPLYIAPDTLRPLPSSMCGMNCTICDRRLSKWERTPDGLGTKKGEPVCSLCMLYESGWSKGKREDIDRMIRNVEIVKEEIFQKQDDGRLLLCINADAIVFGIVVESREHFQREVLKQTRAALEGELDE